jgi:BirA family biotin operon repressor/biotin-[acetyl-CoA-carboxylase] ligase
MADPLLVAPTPERLTPLLETRWLGRAYEWHDACASTSDRAAERARGGAPEGLVVAADRQTGGRGRLGRTWHSPAGENLYFSMVLRPVRPPSEVPPLTLLAGVAVADTLAALGARPRLKWPNDVLLEDDGGGWRKVAGILTEMSTEGERVGHVVVGVGLNVNGADFPAELAASATSLRAIVGRPLDRAEVLAALLGALEQQYDDFRAAGPAAGVAAWQAYGPAGERCRVRAPGAAAGSHQMIEGIALGVDPDGALRVRDDAGRVHRVLSGEIAT